MISLFQTASGSWHIPSILMASSWLLGALLTGVFMFANLRVNRNDRIKAFEKEQQSVIAASEARTKIAELEEKTKQKPLQVRLRDILSSIDSKILLALRAGTRNFTGGITASQFHDLQKIAGEAGAKEFIAVDPDVKMGVGMGPEGITYGVKFSVDPKLLNDENFTSPKFP